MSFSVAPADLADPRLRRLIVRLAIPSVIGLVINALYYAVDAAFLAHLGTEAVAAVSIALPLFSLVAAVGEGLGVGTAATIGRLLGAGRRGRADITASSGLAAALVLGMAGTLVLLIAPGPVLRLLGADGAVLPIAEVYTRILAITCVMTLAQILCDFIAIAEGNTRFSMLTLLAAFCLNMVLDPLFIFGFGWGVEGAAWATVIAKLAALGAYGVYFSRHWGLVRVHPRLVRWTRAVLAPVAAVGVPAGAGAVLTALSFALLYRQAAAHGGEAALAAVGIAARLLMLGYFPVIGFCLGAQAVLSHSFGAGDLGRLRAAVWFMLAVCSGFAALYAGLMVGFAPQVVGLFSTDPAVREHGAWAVRALHLPFVVAGLEYVALVLLQSLGRGKLSALIGLAPQGYLLIPGLLLLPPLWGVEGVIYAQALAIALGGVLTLPVFLGQMRRLGRG